MAITSKTISSQTSTVVLSAFSVTNGISGLFVSGGKNTIGQFPITFSLGFFQSSLSYNVTQNINSQGILGNEKYAYGMSPGVIFVSNGLLGSSL